MSKTGFVEFIFDSRFIAGCLVGWYINDNRPRRCASCGHQNLQAVGPMDPDARLNGSQRRMAYANEFFSGATEMAQGRVVERASTEASESFDSLFGEREPPPVDTGWGYG